MESKRVKLDDSGKAQEVQTISHDLPLADEFVKSEAVLSVSPCANSSMVAGPLRKLANTQPDPIPGRCQFYLKKKRRYCKTIPHKDQPYCVEHSHLLGESDRKRIPCPLDPKHTCYEDGLKKHLKKCNSRQDLQPDFYVKGINTGESDLSVEDYKVGIRDISDVEVLQFVKKVRKLHEGHTTTLKEDILFHSVLQSAADDPKNGAAALKHINQVASLVAHAEKRQFVANDTTFIEFGAGKGGLSHWLQLASKDKSNTKFVLVDRSSVRYKMDSYHRGKDQGPSFERLKVDIEHMHLGKIKSLHGGEGNLVGVGKHLCGAATDLMLRCLVKTLKQNPTDSAVDQLLLRPLGGIVLALCCHHRCDWKAYTGKEYMADIGLTPREFHLLVSMSSWATCGTRSSKILATEDEHAEHTKAQDDDYNHPRYGSLRPEERELLGYQCKQLIDTGRIRYLKDAGLDTELLYFTEKRYSLENMAIVATASSK